MEALANELGGSYTSSVVVVIARGSDRAAEVLMKPDRSLAGRRLDMDDEATDLESDEACKRGVVNDDCCCDEKSLAGKYVTSTDVVNACGSINRGVVLPNPPTDIRDKVEVKDRTSEDGAPTEEFRDDNPPPRPLDDCGVVLVRSRGCTGAKCLSDTTANELLGVNVSSVPVSTSSAHRLTTEH